MYRWVTRQRLKAYIRLLNSVVEKFNRERLMKSMFKRWIEKRRRVQVVYYTEKIAVGRWKASILRRALVAWKVRERS
jgi:hypothetical protein